MLSSKKFDFMWLLHNGTVIMYRYIMKKADGPFDKKELELGILNWMPYLEVLSPSVLFVILMEIYLQVIGYLVNAMEGS